MKKLYRKGTVHPSPPIISDHLAFLPATILTLAAALSPEDREVLAYLISCSNNSVNISSSSSSSSSYAPRRTTTTAASAAKRTAAKGSGSGGVGGDHPARFNCNCFRCYTSYWVRWDESPNRQLIHEIIDAFEDGLLADSKGNSKCNSKKERRNKKGNNGSGELKRSELSLKKELAQAHKMDQETGGGSGGGGVGGGEVDDQEDTEKGSVRRFVSFLGERIWGVWSQ